MLSDSVNSGPVYEVEGSTVEEALDTLFRRHPGLRNHLTDEKGAVRQHVLVFVDGRQAGLDTVVGPNSEIRVLHAVSGGAGAFSGAK